MGVWFCDDLGHRGATFCSPRLYPDLILPFYVELTDLLDSSGIPVVLHSCGYSESVLDLVVQSGFDALHPMEVKAGNGILRIAKRYADKLVCIGGFDARILESHDHYLIASQITAYLDGLMERGARLVFGSDHSVSTNVDYENIAYAVEVYRRYVEQAGLAQ